MAIDLFQHAICMWNSIFRKWWYNNIIITSLEWTTLNPPATHQVKIQPQFLNTVGLILFTDRHTYIQTDRQTDKQSENITSFGGGKNAKHDVHLPTVPK